MPNYWIVGAMGGGRDDWLPRFLEGCCWLGYPATRNRSPRQGCESGSARAIASRSRGAWDCREEDGGRSRSERWASSRGLRPPGTRAWVWTGSAGICTVGSPLGGATLRSTRPSPASARMTPPGSDGSSRAACDRGRVGRLCPQPRLRRLLTISYPYVPLHAHGPAALPTLGGFAPFPISEREGMTA